MIARISTGNFLAGAIAYNQKKVEEGKASVIMFANLGRNDNIRLATSFMLEQANENSRVQNSVFSCSLNLNQIDLNNLRQVRESQGEEAENDLYRQIAQRYMDGMGYGKQPFIVFKHDDIERQHIHVVSVRVDEEGKKVNNTFEHMRSERVRQEVNQEFGLSTKGELKRSELTPEDRRAFDQHIADTRQEFISRSKVELTQLSKPEALAEGDSDLRHKMSNILKFVNENYEPKNMAEYNKVLSQFNLVCKKVEGESANGKAYAGCQYAVADEKGQPVSHLIKASAINRDFSLNAMELKFAHASGSSQARFGENQSKQFVKDIIDLAVSAPQKHTLDSVLGVLKQRGVNSQVVYSRDDDKKVIGLTFIDNVNGHTFNASALGKAYSAGNLQRQIDQHNAKMGEGSLIPKDKYALAFKQMNHDFTQCKSESNIYLTTSAIKAMPDFRDKMEHSLMEKLLLTPAQASMCFDKFHRNALASLHVNELNENEYLKKQVQVNVQFAKLIPNEQDRADFLCRSGLLVQPKADGGMVFTSAHKTSVQVDLDTIIENTKQTRIPITEAPFKPWAIPTPSEDLKEYTKTERSFVKSVVLGEVKRIKGDFSETARYLGSGHQNEAFSRVAVDKELFTNTAKAFNAIKRELQRDTYKYESDTLLNIDRHDQKFIDKFVSLGHNAVSAAAMLDKFKRDAKATLPAVLEKEHNVADNRIVTAVLFAQKIEKPSDRMELLNRMGIETQMTTFGYLKFSLKGRPDHQIDWQDVVGKSKGRIEPGTKPLFEHTLPSATNENARAFSKDERNFVSHYVAGDWGKAGIDLRFQTAKAYLPQSEKNDVQRLNVSNSLVGMLDRNPNATIDAIVKAMLYRGYIIKRDEQSGCYLVGQHNADKDSYAVLPKNLATRLDASGFNEVYPQIKSMVISDEFRSSQKLNALQMVSRAIDYNDDRMFQNAVDYVARQNPVLADAMREAVRVKGSDRPDYERVQTLLFEYHGQSAIKLPPPTAECDSLRPDGKFSDYADTLRHLKEGSMLSSSVAQARKDLGLYQDNNDNKQSNSNKF